MADQVHPVYRFDDSALDPSERSLTIAGRPVALGARAFDLLVALVERAGRLVAKDELLDVVWGRVIVEEANLHVHISALRKVLGPKAIATIPGRGYRFEAKLRAAELPESPPVASERVPAVARAEPTMPQPPDLIGRDDDLAALVGLLDRHRLVTVTGPGGIGKTRIARAALWSIRGRFPDGAAMVELASLTDPSLIPGAIAGALGLPLAPTPDPAPDSAPDSASHSASDSTSHSASDSVSNSASGSASDSASALIAALRPLDALLVIDNAEHLVDAVARIVEAIRAGAPALTVLVTSQLPLRIRDEQAMRLGRLAVPEAPEDGASFTAADALAYGAVRLLDERIRAADRRFRLTEENLAPAIAICRRLDGIALAIELAAARVPLLGLRGVAQRLDERFRLLTSGSRTAPTRQQTLQSAMDWSYGLLTAAQKVAFARLGVFAGGFSLALAQPVLDQEGIDEWGSVDLLAELVDRSLVSIDAARDGALDAPRYRLLETGRAYALDRLASSGELEQARGRHASAVGALFDAAYDECWTLPENDFVARYEPELDNLRAAVDWTMRNSPADAVALLGASGRLWRWLSLHPEALSRSRQAAALIDARTPPAIAARLWESIAQLSGEISSVDSRPAARNALVLYEALGDDRGRYLALAHLAFSFRSGSDEAEAAYATMRSIEDPRWPPSIRLYGTKVRGGLASDARRIDDAREAHETRLALARAAGSEREINAALGNLADLALIAGDARDAVARGEQLIARLEARHMATRAIALGNLLLAQLAMKAIDAARATQHAFIGVTERLGYLYVMYAADAMALLAAHEKRWQAAAAILGYADAAYRAQSEAREPNEAQARDRAAALLARSAADDAIANDAVARWMAEGAALDAPAVCALASGRD